MPLTQGQARLCAEPKRASKQGSVDSSRPAQEFDLPDIELCWKLAISELGKRGSAPTRCRGQRRGHSTIDGLRNGLCEPNHPSRECFADLIVMAGGLALGDPSPGEVLCRGHGRTGRRGIRPEGRGSSCGSTKKHLPTGFVLAAAAMRRTTVNLYSPGAL